MLPSMRYETKKLSQLFHMKKSFQNHRKSISNIKDKSLKSPVQRSKDLIQLRERMHSAFNYIQMVKSRQIKTNNKILYQKCYGGRKSSTDIKKQGFYNQQQHGKQFQDNNMENKSLEKNRQYLLLRNHRNSPINKMTGYERTRENLRLAVKIALPCPAINTKKLQQIHEETRKRKQRIMMYQESHLKSSRYLDKRLSKSRQNSLSQTSKMSQKSSIFREGGKYQNHTFYIRKK